VRISVLSVPSGAAELGIVQAHTVGGSIEDAMPAFREQVADLGGDFGKVNDIKTTFEMRMVTSTESYNCGSADKPSTCTRTVTRQVELVTTRLLGKAYRLGAVKVAERPQQPPTPAPQPAATAAAAPPPPAAAAPPAAPAAPPPTAPTEAPPAAPAAAPPASPAAASFPTSP
jgi:hypothetical protein